jgi:hypothetical protein
MEISSDTRFIDCLSHLADKFGVKITAQNSRIVLKLPKSIDADKLLGAVATQIITTMKSYYIQRHISLKDPRLIEILSRYDNKTDLIIASALLEITPKMLLDSIYDFRLTALKKRWDEVVSLVNDNAKHLACKSVYDDFLRFLIENI